MMCVPISFIVRTLKVPQNFPCATLSLQTALLLPSIIYLQVLKCPYVMEGMSLW